MCIFFTALDGMTDPQLLISVTSMQLVKCLTGPKIWDGGREGEREIQCIFFNICSLLQTGQCVQAAGEGNLIYLTYWQKVIQLFS